MVKHLVERNRKGQENVSRLRWGIYNKSKYLHLNNFVFEYLYLGLKTKGKQIPGKMTNLNCHKYNEKHPEIPL